jgi:hypothetical protein
MRGRLRKGYTLIEVLGLLPLILAVMAVGYQVSGWLMRVQRVETCMLSDQARMRDIARRVQSDAACAKTAVVRRDDGGAGLELRYAGTTIVYRFAEDLVERTEQSGEAAAIRYDWRFENAAADVKHETIGSSPGVVWLLFTFRAPIERGPGPDYHLATAAAVGRGGGS